MVVKLKCKTNLCHISKVVTKRSSVKKQFEKWCAIRADLGSAGGAPAWVKWAAC